MSYEDLKNLKLPNYSKCEESFNWRSHALGVLLGISLLVYFITISIKQNLNAGIIVSLIIYCLTVCLLYLTSTIYHYARPFSFSKKIKRVLDHCVIYFLIAGTYTPIAVSSFLSSWQGIVLLLMEWILAIVGVVLNALWLEKKIPTFVSFALYIILGWALLFFPSLIALLPSSSFIAILLGGIVYSLGFIVYGIGHAKTYFHCIFHVFCLLGTIIQAIGIIILF